RRWSGRGVVAYGSPSTGWFQNGRRVPIGPVVPILGWRGRITGERGLPQGVGEPCDAGEVAMSENRDGSGPQPPGAGLPDFSQSAPGRSGDLPDFETASGPVTLGEPGERSRKRNRAVVLSQTVFRSALEDDGPEAYSTADRSAEGQEEYVPDPEDPDIAPPPPIFTQAPTTECTVPSHSAAAPATSSDAIRGGDLQYTL